MRIGVLTDVAPAEIDWAAQNGFRSFEWMAFEGSPAGTKQAEWKPFADELAARVRARGLRISAIGALYQNPLDPAQREYARTVFLRAIEVAGRMGVRTVAGFPGSVSGLMADSSGGHPVYQAFEHHLSRLLEFWEPIARVAADHGVRIAFEHCPMAGFHLPVTGFNMLSEPAMWEMFFNETKCDNLGLEWDPSHLICQFIDPVANIGRFGPRIFHVHAKDAWINRPLLETWGICHPGVAEHRFPGLGQANWAQIVYALLRAGYDSDLNIEGWHDPVYRDHPGGAEAAGNLLAGRKFERTGMLIARRTLEQFVPPEE